jgi:hypothetical protein
MTSVVFAGINYTMKLSFVLLAVTPFVLDVWKVLSILFYKKHTTKISSLLSLVPFVEHR